MPTKTSSKSATATIIINLPLPLKNRIDRMVNKGNRTKYILEAIEAKIKAENRKNWVENYIKSENNCHIEMPDRNWSLRNFNKK